MNHLPVPTGVAPAALLSFVIALAVSACAGPATLPGTSSIAGVGTTPHTVVVALDDASLVRVDAAQPARVLHRVELSGLLPEERVRCLDFRPGAQKRLYALTSSNRLLLLDVQSGAVMPVATRLPLAGRRLGCDFTPAGDELRVVSDVGVNLRIDPDSGRVIARDGMLAGDAPPVVVAVASTSGQGDPASSTLYGIDAVDGSLSRHGSAPGARPAVSPRTGHITTVGPLGTGPLDTAAFDIARRDDTALAVLVVKGRSSLYRVDLASGRALPVGSLPLPVWGLAVEP